MAGWTIWRYRKAVSEPSVRIPLAGAAAGLFVLLITTLVSRRIIRLVSMMGYLLLTFGCCFLFSYRVPREGCHALYYSYSFFIKIKTVLSGEAYEKEVDLWSIGVITYIL